MTTEHTGVYLNAIIIVGGGVWVLISALIIYIWKSSMNRITKLEQKEDLTISGLLENPVLTISSHTILCNETWWHLTEKLEGMEKGIRLEIKNAILEAARNGKEHGE